MCDVRIHRRTYNVCHVTQGCVCHGHLPTAGPLMAAQIMTPHVEHVLPMIPGGGTFKDIITDGDGSVEY